MFAVSIGVLLIAWLLCGALNEALEYFAIKGKLNRSRAFIIMLISSIGVIVAVASLSSAVFEFYQVKYPEVSSARINKAQSINLMISLLFVAAYLGIQLKRFWDDG